jgi:hypothetical protein
MLKRFRWCDPQILIDAQHALNEFRKLDVIQHVGHHQGLVTLADRFTRRWR